MMEPQQPQQSIMMNPMQLDKQEGPSTLSFKIAFVFIFAFLVFFMVERYVRQPIPDEPFICLTHSIDPRIQDRNPIRLLESHWLGSQITNIVAKILIEEELGYPVNIVRFSDSSEVYNRIRNGSEHGYLDAWSQELPPPTADSQDADLFLGNLGVYMRGGWYVAPDTLLDEYPEFQSWEAFRNVSLVQKVFATPETDPKGQFIDGVVGWNTYSDRIIKRLNLSLQIHEFGEQDDYQAYLDSSLHGAKADKGVLFYHIAPDALLIQRPLKRVALPPYDPECWDIMTRDRSDETKKRRTKRYNSNCACDYPERPAYKLAWPELQEHNPGVYNLFRSFYLTNQDVIEMMHDVIRNTATPYEAACGWLTNNRESWKSWV
eukprot:TRINITY_DN5331_c0_g1_i1.p1 TRINITY_DN5331_c0_g1~~TRINITY_DN5331_c0_g1_i1.p1  ORF type:complete len:375 (-),score=83.96 TRINITY_DN5331_c0_g1_i1:132-1256(-)